MTITAKIEDAPESSIFQRWYVLIIMMFAYTINIADRYVMSTVLEPIRLELKLTDGGVAFLTGVSLALFYVTMGIPLSWIADRYNRRNLLAISITVWSAMTTLCGLSTSYMQLLLARIGVGIGEAGGTPSCNAIVSDYFPAARRPMAMTIFALGAPIGAWLGADMAGYVANRYGWHSAFLVLGIPGILLAAVIMLTIKEPKRGRLDAVSTEETPSLMTTLAFFIKQKAAFHVIMGFKAERVRLAMAIQKTRCLLFALGDAQYAIGNICFTRAVDSDFAFFTFYQCRACIFHTTKTGL